MSHLKFIRRILLAILSVLPSFAPTDKSVLASFRRLLRDLLYRVDFAMAARRFRRDVKPHPRWLRMVVLLLRRFWWWMHPRKTGGMSRNLYLALGVLLISGYGFSRYLNWRIEERERRNTDNEYLFRNEHGLPLVRVTYIRDWASSVAIAYLNAHLLHSQMHADVLFKPLGQEEISTAWAMLANDKADVFLDAWMPAQENFAAQGKNIVHLGELTHDAKMGLAVPAWLPVNSVLDLRNAEGYIYAIDPDSRLNALTRRAVEDYALTDWTVIEKSEAAMLAELRKAISANVPIVVAAWTPHAMFGEYQLKFLEDPRQVFGNAESIHIYANPIFAERFNGLREFFVREQLTVAEFSDLIYAAGERGNVAANVKKWAAQNGDLLQKWTSRQLYRPANAE